MDKNKIEVKYKGLAEVIYNVNTIEHELINGVVKHFESHELLSKNEYHKLFHKVMNFWVKSQTKQRENK